MELPKDPSILVLLVASDGAVWLPDVLKGLRAQQYRPIKVLAVDNASGDGSGAILAKAFGVRRVVTLERRIGYGRALAAGVAGVAHLPRPEERFCARLPICLSSELALWVET